MRHPARPGRLRAIALFDDSGEHAPYDDAVGWAHTDVALDADPATRSVLLAHGITVTAVPVLPLADSGLP